jgi:hypothetical protein
MAFISVPSAATDTRLLAQDGVRGGFAVTNTDANVLYLLLDSSAASATNYSVALATGEAFGLSGYTGEIRGIWAADGSGAALMTSWGR